MPPKWRLKVFCPARSLAGQADNGGSPNKKAACGCPGGAEGNQTPDLFIANEALYQLSYSPETPRRRRLWAVAQYE